MSRGSLVLFRCDGGCRLGLGHVTRCLALSDEFHEIGGFRVLFAMTEDPVGVDAVRAAGGVVVMKPDNLDEGAWLDELIDREKPAALVLDVRSDLPNSRVAAWKRDGLLVATIDDPSDRRLETDFAFYPPVPQVRRLNWSGYQGCLRVGWEWVVLRKQFSSNAPTHHRSITPRILVSMGGSDPAGMTLKVVQSLAGVNADVDLVLGPGFGFEKELAGIGGRVSIHRNVRQMSKLMASADVAVVSFGVTAYELAAMGVPAVYLCLTDDHAESASALADAGMGVNLGLHSTVSGEQLRGAVILLLNDEALRATMSRHARALVDGRGAERMARTLAEQVRVLE